LEKSGLEPILSDAQQAKFPRATAHFASVEIELRGSSPQELQDWLWDFDARPLSEVEPQAAEGAERIGRVGFTGGRLFKTDAFLRAHPFGTVGDEPEQCPTSRLKSAIAPRFAKRRAA
jgi:hypothetical protein